MSGIDRNAAATGAAARRTSERPPPDAAGTGRAVDVFAAALSAARGTERGGTAATGSRTGERGGAMGERPGGARDLREILESGRDLATLAAAAEEETDELAVPPGAPFAAGGSPVPGGHATVSDATADAMIPQGTAIGDVPTQRTGAVTDTLTDEAIAGGGTRSAEREEGAIAVAAPVEAMPFAPSGVEAATPVRAGDTAPALAATAVGTLMDELRALDLPASGRWRFAMPGGALGIDSIVLSRAEGGAWNLRLGAERSRAGGSRTDAEALREALRARGHEVGEIVFGDDDAGGAA